METRIVKFESGYIELKLLVVNVRYTLQLMRYLLCIQATQCCTQRRARRLVVQLCVVQRGQSSSTCLYGCIRARRIFNYRVETIKVAKIPNIPIPNN